MKTVEEVLKETGLVLSEENTIKEVREWLETEKDFYSNYYIIVSNENEFRGIISSSNLLSNHHGQQTLIGKLIKRNNVSIGMQQSLRTAVTMMAKENVDMLPVVSADNYIAGVLSYKDIIAAYKYSSDDHTTKHPSISIKRNSLKILIRGQKLINAIKRPPG